MVLGPRFDVGIGAFLLLGSAAFALVTWYGSWRVASDLAVTALLAGAGAASLAASRRPETAVVGVAIEYRGLRTLSGVLLGTAILLNSIPLP